MLVKPFFIPAMLLCVFTVPVQAMESPDTTPPSRPLAEAARAGYKSREDDQHAAIDFLRKLGMTELYTHTKGANAFRHGLETTTPPLRQVAIEEKLAELAATKEVLQRVLEGVDLLQGVYQEAKRAWSDEKGKLELDKFLEEVVRKYETLGYWHKDPDRLRASEAGEKVLPEVRAAIQQANKQGAPLTVEGAFALMKQFAVRADPNLDGAMEEASQAQQEGEKEEEKKLISEASAASSTP